MTRRALIMGIGGQDGSFLAEQLLAEGVEVHGLFRRSSVPNLRRLDHLAEDGIHRRLRLHGGDVTDAAQVAWLVKYLEPDEVYHLADQDEVGHSFAAPAVSVAVTYGGTVNVLEAVRRHAPEARVFVPSSATIFGNAPPPQDESTPLSPRSPYAVAKAAVLHACRMYREVHGLKVWCGIMFNHDSERRGGGYLLQEIARKALAVARGETECLTVGNPDARVDVGYAPEYMAAAWKMLQTDTPDDYVIGTGLWYEVRHLAESALWCAGVQDETRKVKADPHYKRTDGSPTLCADSSKAKAKLRISLAEDAERVLFRLVERGEKCA